jgi:signal transduction histidine kinase
MDLLLHDERVRIVLRQLPRILSTAIPLDEKLAELCATAVDVLRAESAAVVLLGEETPLLDVFGEVHPDVLGIVSDPEQVRVLVASRGVVRQTNGRSAGLFVALGNERDTFGALYIARDVDTPFSTDEEDITRLYAEAVGPALHHGMRLLSTERGERWTAAAVRLTEQLLGEETDDLYAAIVDVVWDLAEADVVGIVVPEDGQVHVKHVRGMGLETLRGATLPLSTRNPPDLVPSSGGRIANAVTSDSEWLSSNVPDVRLGPLLAIPLRGAKGPLGVLYLARREGAPAYMRDHLARAETFAVNAAVSMEWHAARQTHDELRMLQERNRIARDLHDNVVQRLFATGLYLQQASRTLEGEAKERVEGAMTAVDQTIRQIRNTILVLRSTAADRLDNLLTTTVAETAPLLGFSPALSMAPDVSQVTGPLAADLALCLREALSNVVQHARATAVEITVSIEDSVVVMRISDNGVGIHGDRRPGGGLANLDERARAHGGTFTYASGPDEGTTLSWRMPLSPAG